MEEVSVDFLDLGLDLISECLKRLPLAEDGIHIGHPHGARTAATCRTLMQAFLGSGKASLCLDIKDADLPWWSSCLIHANELRLALRSSDKGKLSLQGRLPLLLKPASRHRAEEVQLVHSLTLSEDSQFDVSDLGLFLSGLAGLSELTLRQGCLKAGIGSLVQCLPPGTLTSLTHLELGNMAMGDIEAAALAPLLVRLKGSLQHLGLSHNNFRAEGTAMLAGVLPEMTALRSLQLESSIRNGRFFSLGPSLGALTMLTMLDISNNLLRNHDHDMLEEAEEVFWSNLGMLTQLRHLNLGGCDVGGITVGPLKLGSAIMNMQHLELLDLHSNLLGETYIDEPGSSIWSAIGQLKGSLQHLDLDSNGIDATTFATFSRETLFHLTQLTCLKLNANSPGEEELIFLAGNLSRFKNLRILELKSCDVTPASAKALVRASALGMFAELRHLSLGNNRTLQAAGVKELACVLMCLSTPLYLTHLDISRACGDDDPESPAAAKSLALALSRLNSLKHLNLGTNDGFGAKGNEAIAQAVGVGCPNLEFLDASTCCADRHGLLAWADALKHLTGLKHLDLANNLRWEVDDDFSLGPQLAPALAGLTALTYLDLSYNYLCSLDGILLAPSIGKLNRLRHVHLQYNFFQNEGLLHIGHSLEGLKDLKLINVQNNHATGLPRRRAAIEEFTSLLGHIEGLRIVAEDSIHDDDDDDDDDLEDYYYYNDDAGDEGGYDDDDIGQEDI